MKCRVMITGLLLLFAAAQQAYAVGNITKCGETQMQSKNQEKFDALKELHLPFGQYAITGSGPMGIRNLKEIGDIDIIVNEELWNALAKRYGVIDENGIKRIEFPGGLIEALGEDSFYSLEKDPEDPLFKERIQNAELIDGLPFESLEHVLYYKKKMGRDKDLRDVELIQEYLDS